MVACTSNGGTQAAWRVSWLVCNTILLSISATTAKDDY